MSDEAVAAVELGLADAMAVFQSLDADEWARPSGCSGWRVQDVAAHMSSNFKVTCEPPPPPPTPLPPMPAERLMDMLVEPRLDWTPQQVLDELTTYGPRAVETLRSLQQEPVASAPLTVADLGTYPMHELADAYAFDVYCHLRIDVLRPRGPIDRQVAPTDEARLGPAIGWMMAGIPQMQGAAFTMVDRPIQLRLTGPGGGTWTVAGNGDGNVMVEAGQDGSAAATVTSDGHAFVLWGTTREGWRDHVTVDGDEALASGFLDTLNIV